MPRADLLAKRAQVDLKTLLTRHLRALMEANGLSQIGLARAAGERQQDVNRLFKGQMKNPSLEFLDGLFRVFDRTLADALRDELPPPTIKESETRFLVHLRALDAADRWAVERVLIRGAAAPSAPKRRATRDE